MGTASGFDWDTLEPFVTSFVMHVKNAELVLFLKDISDFTLDRLKRCGEGVLKIEPFEYRKIEHIGIDRFKNFKRYIDAYGNNYEQIFITDTRDVIFQSDVFDCFKGQSDFLVYSSEADNFRGSKTGYRTNYMWFVNIFGKEEADKLLDKKIICAGSALLGTPREVKTFLEILLSNDFASEKVAFDQVMFNYLIHNNLIPIKNLTDSDVESGAIFTAGLADNFYIQGDEILRNGGVPAVVHQYDRHKPLIQLVNEIYRDKAIQVDDRFNDIRSVIEQIKSLVRADKINEATKIFMKRFLSNDDFSFHGGDLMKLWRFTLQKPLTKQLEVLELAIQYAATLVQNWQGYSLNKIHGSLKLAKNLGHPIDFEFKVCVANTTLKLAQQNLDSNNPEMVFFCVNAIEELDMPPDKDFYLFAAKANRIFGKKDEALAAYKRALELS